MKLTKLKQAIRRMIQEELTKFSAREGVASRINESTSTAVSLYKAAYLLFDSGKTEEEVKRILDNIKQPSEGYVYIRDVMKYINK